MAKYEHIDVLDGGLNVIKNSATKMLLLKAYTLLDSYATVTGNAICSVDMVSGDFVITGADGASRTVTIASKTQAASAPSGATPNLHVAFTDGTSRVLLVTDETSDAEIFTSDPITFPQMTYTRNQAT